MGVRKYGNFSHFPNTLTYDNDVSKKLSVQKIPVSYHMPIENAALLYCTFMMKINISPKKEAVQPIAVP